MASNHPRRIRSSGDGAKLVSTPTDQHFYTYKGRFYEDHEACSIGEETTQKAHNALRWLISRQGYRNGDQTIISWAISGKDLPKITDRTFDFLEEAVEDENTQIGDVGQRFARRLNNRIRGYHQNLGSGEQIVVMGMDSATPGRISVTFYRELTGSQFLERIEKWHTDFSWYQFRSITTEMKKKSFKWLMSAPSPSDIAISAYGYRIDDKLKKATVERLLPCIIDGRNIPFSLLQSCVHKVSNRIGMEWFEWNQALGITCGLLKGYYRRHSDLEKRREYSMSLDRSRASRDYLFGRLLAIAEKIEQRALKGANENRLTSAERLMLRFSSHPCSTWKNIEESLRPYKNRLRVGTDAGLLNYWEQEIQEVCGLFETEDFIDDSPLSGEYLLGYHCQMRYKKASTDDTTITENEE